MLIRVKSALPDFQPDLASRRPAASHASRATLRDVAAWLLLAGCAVVGSATLAGFAGRWWWRAELASHFRVQYLLLLACAAVLLWLLGRHWQAGLSGLLAGTNLVLVLPLYWAIAPAAPGPAGEIAPLVGAASVYPGQSPTPGTMSPAAHRVGSLPMRAVTMNVHTFNRAHQRALDFVRQESPDFVLVLEVGQAWAAALESLQAEYPYYHVEPREDHFGIALFSRREPESLRVRALVWPEFPCLIAELTIDGQSLSIIGAHPVPPVRKAGMAHRNHQLADLAQVVQRQQGEVVLLGDLNTTSWSPYFVDLLRETHLRDSRRGFGVQGTWPVGSPWLVIPIDHCLVSPGIEVVNRRVGPDIGSDHYPVVVDFHLRPPSLAARHRSDENRLPPHGS